MRLGFTHSVSLILICLSPNFSFTPFPNYCVLVKKRYQLSINDDTIKSYSDL